MSGNRERMDKEDAIAASSSSSSPVSPADPRNTTSPRHFLGNSINIITDAVNENIIIARYSTIASIALLTAYGISKTPIFFRYKNVSEVPSSLFTNRRTIHGRIVHVVEKDHRSFGHEYGGEEPIVCLVRQLSPMARLLNRSSFDFMVRMNPSSQLNGKEQNIQDAKDLLKVEIAGIKAPPLYYAPGREGALEWLKGLSHSRAPVSCMLLSRRILRPMVQDDGNLQQRQQQYQHQRGYTQKTSMKQDIYNTLDPEMEQTAVAKVLYRPGMSLVRKDLASSLLSFGRANIASGIHVDVPSMPTVDGSTKLGYIEADVKYLEDLAKYEFEAVKAKQGMWGDKDIRNSRQDLVEEADFETKAGFWKKLWRKIRRE